MSRFVLTALLVGVLSCARGADGFTGYRDSKIASCRLAAAYAYRVTQLDSTATASWTTQLASNGDVAGRRLVGTDTLGAAWQGSALTFRDLGTFRPVGINSQGDLVSNTELRINGDTTRTSDGMADRYLPSLKRDFSGVVFFGIAEDRRVVFYAWQLFHSDWSVVYSGQPDSLTVQGKARSSGAKYGLKNGFLIWGEGPSQNVVDFASGATIWTATNATIAVNTNGDAAAHVLPTSCTGVCSSVDRLTTRAGSITTLSFYPTQLNAARHMVSNDLQFWNGTNLTPIDSTLKTAGWHITGIAALNDADQMAATAVRTSGTPQPVAVRLDKASCP